MIKNINIISKNNNSIFLTLYYTSTSDKTKCIIYSHGFKGFKDWGFIPYIAETLSNEGFFIITFNYSHNGVSKNSVEFDELEKFAKNTFSLEISELREIIDRCFEGEFSDEKDINIGLIGHSRGGADVLLSAVNNEKVKAVVTWSSISKLDRYSERQKLCWEKDGHWDVLNSRTKQTMRMDYTLLKDIIDNSSSTLNIKNAVMNLNKPLLICHGDNDLAVKIQEGKELFEWSNHELSEFFVINNTGHTYGAVHPFEGTNQKLEQLLKRTITFFKINL